MPKLVRCPQCGKDSEYSPANIYRPFCSHRCQLIDLGQWADEKYAIPLQESESRKDEDPDSKTKEDQPDGDLPGEGE
jgi:endogenous inhibitor of DNA gyrase (YacG/DUF329 family)